MADGINNIGNLRGKVDSNNALVVSVAAGSDMPAPQTISADGIGTTSTDGLVLENGTDAAVGAQQYSPRLRLRGEGWKTDATAASQTVDYALEVQPVQGTSAPTGNLILKASINGGAYSTVGTFTSGGIFTSGSSIVSSGSVQAVASQDFRWQSRSALQSPADGTVRVLNAAQTNTYDITLADWGTTLSAEAVALANDAAVSIGAAVSGTVHVSYPADAAIFVARGTANAVRLADGSATFTTTKDNASTVNFYYDTDGYYLQNKTGGSLNFRVLLVGG